MSRSARPRTRRRGAPLVEHRGGLLLGTAPEPEINAALAHLLLAAAARRAPRAWAAACGPAEWAALRGRLATRTAQAPTGPLDAVLGRYAALVGPAVVVALARDAVAGDAASVDRVAAPAGAGPQTPGLAWLLDAPDPWRLAERWHALQARGRHPHVSVFAPDGDRALRVARVAPDGAPRVPAREAAVCGLVAGILTAHGCRDLAVDLTLSDGAALPLVGRGAVSAAAAARLLDADGGVATWVFRWSARRRPDEHRAARPGAPPAFAWPALVSRVHALVDAPDPPVAPGDGPPSLPAVAHALGRAPRTLQRRLREAGVSLDDLRRSARVRRACVLLGRGVPPRVVATRAGFADASHLGRDVRRLLGLTPAEIRAASRPPGTPS